MNPTTALALAQFANSEKSKRTLSVAGGILIAIIVIVAIEIYRRKQKREKYRLLANEQGTPYWFAQRIFDACPRALGIWWDWFGIINKGKDLITNCDETETLNMRAQMIENNVTVQMIAVAFKQMGYGDLREHLDRYLDSDEMKSFYA